MDKYDLCCIFRSLSEKDLLPVRNMHNVPIGDNIKILLHFEVCYSPYLPYLPILFQESSYLLLHFYTIPAIAVFLSLFFLFGPDQHLLPSPQKISSAHVLMWIQHHQPHQVYAKLVVSRHLKHTFHPIDLLH